MPKEIDHYSQGVRLGVDHFKVLRFLWPPVRMMKYFLDLAILTGVSQTLLFSMQY